MELLNVLLSAIFSLVALFVITKLIGNRQVSQLSLFDYINGITIGSIAAEMATALENDVFKPLIALAVYGLLTALISVLTNKSLILRRFFGGEAIVLFDNGTLYRKNLTRSKMDIYEFLFLLRNQGYFHLKDIQTVILESNGRLSVLPTAQSRPCCPNDFSISLTPEKVELVLVVDGVILKDNLKASGNNETWLKTQLHAHNISNLRDVALATCDGDNTLHAYRKCEKGSRRDWFQ